MTVNVYHKHSVVKNKAPEAKQIELGEIAINANQDSPALYIKDASDRVLQIGGDITQIEEDIKHLHDLIDSLNNILPNPIDGSTNLLQLLSELGDLKDQVDRNTKCCSDAHEEIKQLQLHVEQLVENALKGLAALEAQVLLLAQHNVEQDGRLDGIEAELKKIETNINEIAKSVHDLDDRTVELLRRSVEHDRRLDVLETVKVTAGNGVVVKRQGDYEFKVSIDKTWLDAYLKKALAPYALIDFGTHTDEVPNP